MATKQSGEQWLKMPVSGIRYLPKDRHYTELEAMFSIILDLFRGNEITISGKAKTFGWSRWKVRKLLENEWFTSPTLYRHLKDNNINDLQSVTDTLTDSLLSTIRIDKNIHANACSKRASKKEKTADPKITVFREWFCDLYKQKFKREYVIPQGEYGKIGKQIKSILSLNGLSWLDLQYITIEFIKDTDPFLESAGHNFGTLLAKLQQNCYSQYRETQFRKDYEKFIVDDEKTG